MPVIQIMEALWLMMHIIISARLWRLITIPMIVWRNIAIVVEIFLCLRRLEIHVNRSRSRPFQGQEMSAQMHR